MSISKFNLSVKGGYGALESALRTRPKMYHQYFVDIKVNQPTLKGGKNRGIKTIATKKKVIEEN